MGALGWLTNEKNAGTFLSTNVHFRKYQFCGLTMSKQLILGLKILFTTTILKENKFAFTVAPFILHLNDSKRAFVTVGFLLPQQKLLENAKVQHRKLLFYRVPIIRFEWKDQNENIWRLNLQFWGHWWPRSSNNDLFTKGQFFQKGIGG